MKPNNYRDIARATRDQAKQLKKMAKTNAKKLAKLRAMAPAVKAAAQANYETAVSRT